MAQIPYISIIIPTLQEGKTISRTLEQFTPELRKRYDLEIIVSDGGSTDDSVPVARPRSDQIVLNHPGSKQNISIGRNSGANAARGKIFIFLNADVLIEDKEKFFSTLTDVFNDKRVAAATCNVNIYPEEERIRDWMFHNFFNGYFWLLNMIGMGMGRGECHVVRREVFEKSHGYNPALAAGEDYDFFMRLRRFGKVKFLRNLTVFESPRRFRKYGYCWITLLWFLNAVSVLLFRRSLVDHWKPIR